MSDDKKVSHHVYVHALGSEARTFIPIFDASVDVTPNGDLVFYDGTGTACHSFAAGYWKEVLAL